MRLKKSTKRNPWAWVPTLYFAEGIPYVVVMLVSVIMYKRLGLSNADIALYTSWLYLPWVIKPFWSPIVDILKTKRLWIIIMQLIVGAGLAGVALTIPVPNFFKYTLAFFWLLAFSSATHDIAADGFYMLGLSEHQQAFFVGIRSMFYRFAMITGQGLLIILAGYIETSTGLPSVDVNVHSLKNYSAQQIINPDSIKIKPLSGKLRIIVSPEKLNIGTVKISKRNADSLKALVKNWNLKNGFIIEKGNKASKHISKAEQTWWHETVVVNLEYFLKKYFGPKKKIIKKSKYAGNIGIIYFHLSKKPRAGKKIVINFGSKSGDKSIALVEGRRFEFNRKNWNKPAFSLFQLDPKLKINSAALFEARAGNIPL